jgi:transcriptional regulator with GAF, ATPase, and Fis domain
MDTELLSDTFVDLADTMVADFDVIDFLQLLTDRSVKLLAASAAGVVLADPRGQLRVAAASSEAAGLIELFQIQNDQGPCLDCFRTSRPIAAPDLRGRTEWPRFIAHTLDTGYRSVHAVPMRLRTETIGALNLFAIQPRALRPDELRIAQALADVATIGILQERAIRRREVLAEQLQVALNSRVIIEQAKGVLAERGQLEMERAFEVLRGHARSTQQRLSDVALAVATRTIPADVILGPLHGNTSP